VAAGELPTPRLYSRVALLPEVASMGPNSLHRSGNLPFSEKKSRDAPDTAPLLSFVTKSFEIPATETYFSF
jgi:hypothetical protein